MWGKEKEELQELEEFLKEKINIKSKELVGYVSTFKRDTEVTMQATTEHSLTINIKIVIKAGTEIRVLKPCCGIGLNLKFVSMRDTVVIEIVNPQILTGRYDLYIKEFVDAIT